METFIAILAALILIGKIFKPWENPKQRANRKKQTKNKKHANITTFKIDETDREIISFNFRVVGIGFAQETKNACANATGVYLEAENNPYDKNAIAVYNQFNERIGYIPRDEQKFLNAFHSYKKNIVHITNHYYNEHHTPTNYCEMDIQVQFCGDFDYFEKLLSEEPISRELYHESRELITSFKGKDISDLDKLEQIQEINKKLLAFNKTAERQNLARIPMQETIILMNKLKLDTQLAFIEEHFELSDHTETQRKYVLNYLEKHGNKTKAE